MIWSGFEITCNISDYVITCNIMKTVPRRFVGKIICRDRIEFEDRIVNFGIPDTERLCSIIFDT